MVQTDRRIEGELRHPEELGIAVRDVADPRDKDITKPEFGGGLRGRLGLRPV